MAPPPKVKVKRERVSTEDPQDSQESDSSGSTSQKRARLAEAFARSEPLPNRREFESPDDLAESDFQECWRILRQAVKAQDEQYEPAPEALDGVMKEVFEEEWNSTIEVPSVELRECPAEDNLALTWANPVGEVWDSEYSHFTLLR